MNKKKQITIYDISEEAGVSIATVSRVLNDSPKVSRKTKERVLDIIQASGYEPNAFARGLGTGSMKTIGILCADVADIYLANAVSYLERELRKEGFQTVLNCTGYSYEAKKDGVTLVQPRAGVGLIENHIELLKHLQDEGGADLLPSTIDSYTRQNQYENCAEGIRREKESMASGKFHPYLNGFPAVNHGCKGLPSGCRSSGYPSSGKTWYTRRKTADRNHLRRRLYLLRRWRYLLQHSICKEHSDRADHEGLAVR